MMRRLIKVVFIVMLFCVFTFSDVNAQSQVVDIDLLRMKIDSLTTLQSDLKRKLDAIGLEIDESSSLLKLGLMKGAEAGSVALLTNMEASLRARPSPDGRVLRILPAKTPLVAIDYNGSYWKVRYQGTEGWIMRLFVDEGEGAAELKQKLTAAGLESPRMASIGASELALDRLGKRFLVTDFGIHPPNSAGGVSVYYAFEHLDSTRTVREVTFSITPFNESGLKEKGMNSGTSTKRLRRFGPISVHDGEKQYQFENVWYNASIRCAEIDRLDIVYTDGTRVSHRQDVGTVLAGVIENDCTMTTADQIDAGPDNE